MTCQERRDLLLAYAAGALEPAEAAELREHLLTGCPVCAGALAEAEAVVHRLPEGLTAVEVPAGAWGRIEKRTKLGRNPKMRLTDWVGWVVAASVLVLAFFVLESNYVTDAQFAAQQTAENARLSKELRAALAEREAAVRALADAVDEQKQMNVRLTGLEEQVKTLSTQNEQVRLQLASVKHEMMEDVAHMVNSDKYEIACAGMPGVKGTVYVDRKDGMCMLTATNLQPLPAGKTYEMWMIDDKGNKMPAGTFGMNKDGVAMHDYEIPAGMTAKGMVAVTDEPMGGMPQPTGSILFAAEIR